ncbi:hypothetical protein BD414DRAFT_309067 [Trametes punicea]|nr:hypothetical protein BD414DRAFT_309067 [Trametes punicea]
MPGLDGEVSSQQACLRALQISVLGIGSRECQWHVCRGRRAVVQIHWRCSAEHQVQGGHHGYRLRLSPNLSDTHDELAATNAERVNLLLTSPTCVHLVEQADGNGDVLMITVHLLHHEIITPTRAVAP